MYRTMGEDGEPFAYWDLLNRCKAHCLQHKMAVARCKVGPTKTREQTAWHAMVCKGTLEAHGELPLLLPTFLFRDVS